MLHMSAISKKKYLIQNNVKLLSLSSIILVSNTFHINAQTITDPIIITSDADSKNISNKTIDIQADNRSALQVKNATLSITESDISLESNKHTVEIQSNSDVTLIGSEGKKASIFTTGTTSNAIYQINASKLHIEGFKIGTSGTNASGLSIQGTYNQINSHMSLNNTQINTLNGKGILARDSNIVASNFRIVTGRDETTGIISNETHRYGIHAENKNLITLSDGYIETRTNYSVGINVIMDLDNSTVERLNTNNVHIVTYGANATGIDSLATNSSINGGSIVTHGIGGHGVGTSNGGASTFAPGHVRVTGTQITTNGIQGYGLVATTFSDIQAKSVNISTFGESGVGIYSQGTGHINVSDNSFVSTTGKGAHAIAVMLGSKVNITDTTIKTTGINAAGIYMTGNNYQDDGTPQGKYSDNSSSEINAHSLDQSPANENDYPEPPQVTPTGDYITAEIENGGDRAGLSHDNIVTLTRSTLDISNGAALNILGGKTNKITITDSVIKANGGESSLLLKSDVYKEIFAVGSAEINATKSKLIGDIQVNSGEINLALSNKSVWSGTAQIGSDDKVLKSLAIDNTSGWLITGNSTVNSLSNTGSVTFLPSGTQFKTLTVQSAFNSNGGLFAINTKLGDDSSETDKIVFQNGVAGNNLLAVHNSGGLGAQTINGIKVIEVEGLSSGAFTLAGIYKNNNENTVVAGAYTYKLYQGSISDPSDGNWYLRSDFDDDGYQAGVPVYEVYPQFLLGLNNLPTMQQRIGQRYWNNARNLTISQGADTITPFAPLAEAGNTTQSNGVWGRMEGSHNKMKPHTSTSDATYDYNAYKLQAGLDGLLHEAEQGKLIGGITVHYTHGLADIWSPNNSDLGRGRIETDGYGFGGTLTWYSDKGVYIDNQAQVTWYRSDLGYQGGQSSLSDRKNNGFGYAFTTELGKRFGLNDQWSLTPQAQIHYSNVNFDSFTDVFDAYISRERAASLQGRLGLSVEYQNAWLNDRGGLNRTAFYGIANLYNEFLNGTRVDVSSVAFTNRSERLWAGIGLGGSYNWNDDRYSIYGESSFNTSLKDFGNSYNYKGTVGFRMKW